jgi:hypothetical protein
MSLISQKAIKQKEQRKKRGRRRMQGIRGEGNRYRRMHGMRETGI